MPTVTCTWTVPVDGGSVITGYTVQRRTGTGTFSTIASPGSGATSHADTTVSASTQYGYRVAAVNAIGTGPWSGEQTVTTAAAVTPPPTYDYYMGPSGSDTNSGTQAAPFATLQKLYNTLGVGQSGGVLPGDYVGSAANLTVGTSAGGSSASNLKRIVGIKDGSGLRPVLRGIWAINGSYGELNSLAFDLSYSAAAAGNVPMRWGDGASTTTLNGWVWDDCVFDGKSSAAQGLLGGAGNNVQKTNGGIVRNCVFANINGPSQSGPGHGIYLQTGSGWTISRNVFYKVGAAYGGSRAVQLYPNAQTCMVEFNTIDECSAGIVYGDDGSGYSSTGHTFRNNIFSNSVAAADGTALRAAISVDVNAGTATITNNHFHAAGTSVGANAGTNTSPTSGDPAYTNRTGRVYTLQAGSPAAGKGYTG